MNTRLAIISDIHANLEAFEAVLNHIASQSVDRILCLGDIVGYNADPEACIALCQENHIFCLSGNHDVAARDQIPLDNFSETAALAIRWTRQHLSEENRHFLRQLPVFHRADDHYLLMHGSLLHPDRYLFFPSEAQQDFETMRVLYPDIRLGFLGHTHQPRVFTDAGGNVTSGVPRRFTLQEERRYLINPGSVGQPRDSNPMASYLIYDVERTQIDFHHVPYDIQKTAEKILKAGLPRTLAERLYRGW